MGLLDDLGDRKIEEERTLASKVDTLQYMLSRIEAEYVKFQREFMLEAGYLILKEDLEEGMSFTEACGDVYDFKGLCEDFNKKKLNFNITPYAIGSFLDRYDGYEDDESFFCIQPFATMLMQNSFNKGHNGFELPLLTNEIEIYANQYGYLGLVGNIDRLLDLTISGDCIDSFCNFVKYSDIKFTGNHIHNCGNHSKNSILRYDQDIARNNAKDVVNSDVFFHGRIGEGCGAKSGNTRFYSPHIDDLKAIKKVCYNGCSFYLIGADGDHKEVL